MTATTSNRSKNVCFSLIEDGQLARQVPRPSQTTTANTINGALSPNIFSSRIEALNKILDRKNYPDEEDDVEETGPNEIHPYCNPNNKPHERIKRRKSTKDEDLVPISSNMRSSCNIASNQQYIHPTMMTRQQEYNSPPTCNNNNNRNKNTKKLFGTRMFTSNDADDVVELSGTLPVEIQEYFEVENPEGHLLCQETCVKLSGNLRNMKDQLDRESVQRGYLERKLTQMKAEQRKYVSLQEDHQQQAKRIRELTHANDNFRQFTIEQKSFLIGLAGVLDDDDVRLSFSVNCEKSDDLYFCKINKDQILDEVSGIRESLKELDKMVSLSKGTTTVPNTLSPVNNNCRSASDLARKVVKRTRDLLTDNEIKVSALEEKLKTCETENIRLDAILHEIELEKQSLAKDKERTTNNLNNELNQKNASLSEELSRLQMEKDSLISEISMKDETISSLTKEQSRILAEFTSMKDENLGLIRRHDAVKFDNKKISLQLEELRKQNDRLNQEYRSFEEETLALQIELFSKLNLIDTLNEKCAEVQRKHEDEQRQNDIRQRQSDEKTSLNAKMKADLIQAQKDIRNLTADLEREIRNGQDLRNELSCLRNEMNSLECKNGYFESEIGVLTTTLNVKTDECDQVTKRRTDLESRLIECEGEKTRLTDKITAMNQRIFNLENDISMSREKSKSQDEKLMTETSNLLKANEIIANQKSELQVKEESILRANEKLAECEAKLKFLNNQKTDLLASYESLKNDLADVSEERKNLSESLLTIESERNCLAEELTKIKNELASTQDSLVQEKEKLESIKFAYRRELKLLGEDGELRIGKLTDSYSSQIDELEERILRIQAEAEVKLDQAMKQYSLDLEKERGIFEHTLANHKTKQAALIRDHNETVLRLETDKQNLLTSMSGERTSLTAQLNETIGKLKALETEFEENVREFEESALLDQETITALQGELEVMKNSSGKNQSTSAKELEVLRVDLETLRSANDTKTIKIKELEMNLASCCQDVEDLRSQLLMTTEENSKLEESEANLKRDLVDLKRIIVDMKTEAETLQEMKLVSIRKCESLERQLAAAQEHLLDNENSLKAAKEDCEYFEAERVQHHEIMTTKDREINRLKASLNEVEKTCKSLENEKFKFIHDSEVFAGQFGDLRRQLNDSSTSIKRLHATVDDLRGQKVSLSQELVTLRSNLEEAISQKNGLAEKLNQVEDDRCSDSARWDSLKTSLLSSLDEANGQVDSLKRKLNEAESKSHNLSDTILHTENERRDIEVKLISLYQAMKRMLRMKTTETSRSLTRVQANERHSNTCQNCRGEVRNELCLENGECEKTQLDGCTAKCVDIGEIRRGLSAVIQRLQLTEKEVNEKSCLIKKLESQLKNEMERVRRAEHKLSRQCSVHDELARYTQEIKKNTANDEVIRHYEEEQDELKKSLCEAERKVGQLNEDVIRMEQERLQTQVTLQRKECEIAKLERSHSKLESDLAEMELKKKSVDGDYERCKLALSQKENELNLLAKTAESKKLLDSQKSPGRGKHQQNSTFNHKISKLEADTKILRNQLAEQKNLYEKTKSANLELLNRMSTMKGSIAEMEAQRKTLEAKIASLQVAASSPKTTTTQKAENKTLGGHLDKEPAKQQIHIHQATTTCCRLSSLLDGKTSCQCEQRASPGNNEKHGHIRPNTYTSPWSRYLSASISPKSRQMAEEALARSYFRFDAVKK